MRSMLAIWLGLAAVAAGTSLKGPLTDLSEQIAAESKADEKAADDARCWCKEVQAELDTRLRESDGEIQNLETIRDTRFYEGQSLKIEIKQHKEQVSMHSQSLDEAGAISSKAKSDHEKEQEQTKESLKGLRKALEKVPKGNEVHGTLQGLEEKFASKLEEADKAHKRRTEQMKEVQEGKTEMLKLARAGVAMKMRRLADGQVVVAQAKSDIAAFNGQQEADYALRAALKSTCSALSDTAHNRKTQRQDADIAISESKAESAHKAAMKSMGKVMLLRSAAAASANREASYAHVLETLGSAFKGDCGAARDRAEDTKRRADEALAHAKKAGGKLLDLVGKSNGIQAALQKVLSKIMMNAHLATMKGKLKGTVKAKVDTIGDTADKNLKALPALFEEVRSAAKKNNKADHKLVLSLQSGAAAAGMAVVEAGKCK